MVTVLLVERMPLSILNSTNPAVIDMCKLLIRKGHKVVALTLSGPVCQDDIETFVIPLSFQRQKNMHKILVSIIFSILAPIYAAYIAKLRQVDIICYNDVVPVFWPIAWLFLKNVKKVHFEGDFLAGYIFAKGLGRLVYNPLFQLERWHWKQYNIVAVTSNAFMKLLLRSDIPEKNIKILSESVDNHLFKVKLNKFDKISMNDSLVFRIVTHGILTYYKGVDILLYAVKKVLDKGYPLHLTIIGDGPEKAFLENLAKKLNIDKVISMLGWVPLLKVPYLISNAHLGVVCRRKNIANDLVLTQALLQYACLHIPILAPDVETIREKMKHGESLILYRASDANDLAEKLIFAIENKSLLPKLAEKAWEIVNGNHTREVIAEKAANICLSLVN